MNWLLKGGRVVDPFQGIDQVADIRVEDGTIAKIGMGLPGDGAETVDLGGLTVTPGLIDMHCHLRQPGFEYKETIATGTRAAAAGGFTAVACMANTSPVNDCRAVTEQIVNLARREGAVRVYPVGAVTHGLEGKELTEMHELHAAGCVAFSDDGKPVADARRMYLAMQYAQGLNLPILSHCEDASLANGGSMNEGYYSAILGLKGHSRTAEEAMVAREIILAQSLSTRVHIMHISTQGSVQLIREARARGVRVTCETCPHYIAGTDAMAAEYDTSTKVNPPLRTEDDRQAVIDGLCDGTIDCIVTDHAPHHQDDKALEYQAAAFGISGLESAFGLCYTHLVKTGRLSLSRLCMLMSAVPASVLQVPGGNLGEGSPADIAVFDTEREYALDVGAFQSKGKNNPFHGQRLYGRAVHTMVGGRWVLRSGTLEG